MEIRSLEVQAHVQYKSQRVYAVAQYMQQLMSAVVSAPCHAYALSQSPQQGGKAASRLSQACACAQLGFNLLTIHKSPNRLNWIARFNYGHGFNLESSILRAVGQQHTEYVQQQACHTSQSKLQHDGTSVEPQGNVT